MGLLKVVGMGSKSSAARVLASLPIPLFALDVKHRVWVWTKDCERLTGIPAKVVLGTSGQWRAFYKEPKPTLADALLDGHLDAHVVEVNDEEQRPRTGSYARWHQFPNGERKYLLVSACLLMSRRGRPMGALQMMKDLTELQLGHEQELTREIRQREKQKMECLSRMAGGIAHDFNNLLTVVFGYARLIREGLGAAHPLLSDVDEIISAANHGARLTQQLLAMSGKHIVAFQRVDLGGLLADITPALRHAVGPTVQVSADHRAGGFFIQADPALLEQAILQLVENARLMMPNGGTLQLALQNERVSEPRSLLWSELTPGHYVRLSISDNGNGMSAEELRHLFEPFYVTNGKRSGFGLSVVWGILQQMHGHITVESVVGKGTRVDLFFPAVGEETGKPSVAVSDKEVVPRGHETVLVVEDEDAVRHLVVLMLRSLGYRVLEAGDGHEAITLASAYDGPIHLVLTDVVMPRMGGLELVKQLRPVRKNLKVLYMSGFTDGRLLDQGLLEAGDDLILKPYTRESLARKIRKVLDGQ